MHMGEIRISSFNPSVTVCRMGKNKRSRKYYIQSSKRQRRSESALGPNMTGFMCTCNDHERDCVREAYNILNEFADQMYGKEEFGGEQKPIGDNDEEHAYVNVKNTVENNEKTVVKEKTDDFVEKMENVKQESGECPVSQKTLDPPVDNASDSDEESLDIEAAVKEDVSVLKKQSLEKYKHQRRFQQVHCGAKNCVFIRTTLKDPLPLCVAIMDDILQNHKQWTKKLLRMIPVHNTCKAFPEDIKKAAERLAKSYFEKESKTYYVDVKIRNNNSVKRESLTASLIGIIQAANSKNTPELKSPEVVFHVDVIKNVCCLSFLPEYFTKYTKYNLVVLANMNKEKNAREDDICKEHA
ncbi:THUMP domain-containing protein 1 isoform X2 [Panulirus ornatus]|uniref:THUMP domain-containing protein 1 isoform X2 n=1 Tax=Panulirus ornatus TaxID=150431 RepID=UPI003A836A4F